MPAVGKTVRWTRKAAPLPAPAPDPEEATTSNIEESRAVGSEGEGQAEKKGEDPSGPKTEQPNTSKPRAAWIASQLKVFFAEPREDCAPDMDVAEELAGWLKLSREAYQARGIKAGDEEIRRTALACQSEHRGGRLPTIDAARGFLSVRLSAMYPMARRQTCVDVTPPVSDSAPKGAGFAPQGAPTAPCGAVEPPP
jgi:hypothetical protein